VTAIENSPDPYGGNGAWKRVMPLMLILRMVKELASTAHKKEGRIYRLGRLYSASVEEGGEGRVFIDFT